LYYVAISCSDSAQCFENYGEFIVRKQGRAMMLLSNCIAEWEANRAVGGLGPCGGLTLAGCQIPIQLLFHYSRSSTRKREEVR